MSKQLDDIDADPILIPHNGRLAWLFPSGRIMNLIRGGAGEDDPKTFTQADVDQLIADRLKRVKTEPPADYDKLKADSLELAALKTKNAADDAKNLSEAEKTNARLAALEADLKKSNDATEAAKAEARSEKVRSAIVAEASKQKAASPDQIAALLRKDAVTLGDDGQVTGAAEAVKAFLAENPHHVGAPARPAPDRGQGKAGETKGLGSAGAAEAAKRFGPPATAGATQQ